MREDRLDGLLGTWTMVLESVRPGLRALSSLGVDSRVESYGFPAQKSRGGGEGFTGIRKYSQGSQMQNFVRRHCYPGLCVAG